MRLGVTNTGYLGGVFDYLGMQEWRENVVAFRFHDCTVVTSLVANDLSMLR